MKPVIFLAEDDKNILQVITEYFIYSGYTIVSETDGSSAISSIDRRPEISLFVLDIMLPGKNGHEILAHIRSSASHREKPVIMLTALSDEATQLECFDNLADDYVTKPFSPKILVRRAAALLRRNESPRSVLVFEDFTLDHERYEVRKNHEEITLTLREFELFSALITHAGKVLSRQQLLNMAWGYDYFGDERIVDVHIKNLRKKLGGNYIATVKGVGYKLTDKT